MIAKKWHLWVIIFIVSCLDTMLIYSICSPECISHDLEISSFEPLCKFDTIRYKDKIWFYKSDAYLLTGYQNTAAQEAQLDSFVCAIQDSTWALHHGYIVLFYKKSKYTNNENIKKNPRHLSKYSEEDDFLYSYLKYEKIFIKTAYQGNLYSENLVCK